MTTRTAVVTGASSGIGAATARSLAEAGFRVFCAARRTERVEALADEIGGVAVTCDVTDDASVAALAQAVGSPLDVLVNNAGGAYDLAPVAEADPDDWRRMYEVNVIGLVRVTQALLPALLAADDGAGIIVNVGSTAGRIAYENGGGYTAAKHGTRWSARRCGSSSTTSRSGSARSPPAWCAPTSSRWSASTATRSAPTPSMPASPSPWWPRTSPTPSRGWPPGRGT